jgi:quinoprotein glucose dehydrogenase
LLDPSTTYRLSGGTGLQTQPLMVNGLVYANTPGHRVISLDASTGALVWKFDAGIPSRGPNRGVAYWSNGREARVMASVSTFLYALDARTGELKKDFGEGGRIDLRRGLGRDDEPLTVTLTSPGVVYRDLLIIGSATGERLPAPPGDIRAYDVRTGEIRWTFRTIPAPASSAPTRGRPTRAPSPRPPTTGSA